MDRTPAKSDSLVPIRIGSMRLSIADVARVARTTEAVVPLSTEAAERVAASAAWVSATVEQLGRDPAEGGDARAYYGINTGFGALAGRTALSDRFLIELLGRNLIASHSVGVGAWLDQEVVRATLLIRAQSLAQGHSGARPVVVETLIRMLNAGVYPAVPELGSLDASGDLAPLAHIMLTMTQPPAARPGQRAPDWTDGEAFLPVEGDLPHDATLHLTEDHGSGAGSG